ncbi:MAG: hypothetical protein GY816_02215 [Cytophagales bacterium]|nr:hypothetical protein [Cytophagales bacterium]
METKHYVDWYQTVTVVNEGDVTYVWKYLETEYVGSTYQTSYYPEPCSTSGAGNNGAATPIIHSPSYIYPAISEADWWEQDKICYDASFINNAYIKNAWDKLISGSITFDMLSNLVDESAEAEVCLYVQDVVTYQGGEVNGITNGRAFPITVTISASKASERSEIDVARTLLHEMIHAEMYRKILSVDGQSGLSPDNFPDIFDYYSRYLPIQKEDGTWSYPNGSPQHNLMAQHYLRQMARVLMQFDGVDPDNYMMHPVYEAIAWAGLHNTEVWSQLDPVEREFIEQKWAELNSRPKCQ